MESGICGLAAVSRKKFVSLAVPSLPPLLESIVSSVTGPKSTRW